VLYFANPVRAALRHMLGRNDLGMIITPKQGNRLPDGVTWIADNGCGPGKHGIGKGYPGDEGFLAFLRKLADRKDDCLFANAPDVVGDARATLERSRPMFARIRELGFMVGFVAQDGLEDMTDEIPWDEFDALFIGGTTAWKLGPAAAELVAMAKARGKIVHFGRTNSLKRMRYAESIGCDTSDGTYLTFGPRKNLPNLLSWLDNINLGIKIPPVRLRAAAYGLA
jgi:hypothetical protein